MSQHEWVLRLSGAIIAAMAVAPVACGTDEEPEASWPGSYDEALLVNSASLMTGTGGASSSSSSSSSGVGGMGGMGASSSSSSSSSGVGGMGGMGASSSSSGFPADAGAEMDAAILDGGDGGNGGAGFGGAGGIGGTGGTGGVDPCPEGTACNLGDPCVLVATCMGGMCVPTMDCGDLMAPPCHVSQCMLGQGCVNVPTSGDACDDGNVCTQVDTCQGGVCLGGSPLMCAPGTLCMDAACDSVMGCTMTAKPDGTACGGAGTCTQMGSCQNGVCSGTMVMNGTPCDDGDACTLSDTCQMGACQGENPVTCPDPLPCFEPGVCDPQTGMCSSPPSPDGTSCGLAPGDCVKGGVCATGVCDAELEMDGAACDDQNPCSSNDTCSMGVCSGVTTLDGVPCPGGLCIAGTCFPEPQENGSGGGGGAGGAGGGMGGSSGAGGTGGVQGGGGAGPSGSSSDDRARLHGGACGVAPGLVGGAIGASISGIGVLIAFFARRRRRGL